MACTHTTTLPKQPDDPLGCGVLCDLGRPSDPRCSVIPPRPLFSSSTVKRRRTNLLRPRPPELEKRLAVSEAHEGAPLEQVRNLDPGFGEEFHWWRSTRDTREDVGLPRDDGLPPRRAQVNLFPCNAKKKCVREGRDRS